MNRVDYSNQIIRNNFLFDTPSNIVDFPDNPEMQMDLVIQWNYNLDNYTNQSIVSDPWTVKNDNDRKYYFNPLTTDIPKDGPPVFVDWTALPNRLNLLFSSNGNSPYGLEQHYSVQRLAELYDMSPDFWRKRVASGEIKAMKLGQSIRIPESEVQRLVEQLESELSFPGRKFSLKEFIPKYLDYCHTNKAKSTAKRDALSLRNFLEFTRDLLLSQITLLLAERFKSDRIQHISPLISKENLS